MKYRYIFIALAMAAGLSACNEKEVVKPVGGETARAVIVNSPDGAQDGEIMVKFRPEVSGLLDQACATKVGGRANVLETTRYTFSGRIAVISWRLHIGKSVPVQWKD